jgi:hypothetical protein
VIWPPLTNVPLVLLKSVTNAPPPLMAKAQWRLLMSALAGRPWHWASRPITNGKGTTPAPAPDIVSGRPPTARGAAVSL